MKKYLRIAMATVVAVLAAPVYGASDVSMCAGQSMDIGTIDVTNNDNYIYVSFVVEEPGWYLAETHVAVDVIPTNKSGNPVPGQFLYACDLDGSLEDECTVMIPLDGLSGEVEIAAHAAVFQLAGDGCGSDIQYANEVVLNNQGFLKNGGPVLSQRSVEAAVFQGGDVNVSDPTNTGFFSLGFDEDLLLPGGDLTVGFGYPVYNAPGNDLCVQEITNGRSSYPEELIEIWGDTTLIDEVSNRANGTGLACVDLPEDIQTVDLVTLYDVTNPDPHNATADAYDVDWVGACYLFLGEETAWGAACYDGEGTRFVEEGNWGTYFNYRVVPNGCALASYGDHDYLICQGQKTRPESDNFCASEGMQLAFISDVGENEFVVDAALAEFGYTDFNSSSYWIGNINSDTDFLPWATGEPNGDGSYIHILRYDATPYGWNDVADSWAWGWVCETAD